MTRAELLAAAAATAVPSLRTPGPSGMTADVSLSREGSALLAPFLVSIALHNNTKNVIRLRFPTTDLFRIDVLRDDTPVWSSLTGHKPINITRQIDVTPGPLKLAQQLVDGTTDDHRAYAPGKYTVRVAMMAVNFGVVVDKTIGFDPPDTIAKALEVKAGTIITIAGEPYVDNGPRLRDDTGSIRLSRGLGLRATGRWVMRGFLDALGDERVFDVGRSAPAYENGPSPAP